MNPPDNTTRLGHFLGPQGLKGGVKMFVLGDAEQLLKLPRIWAENWGWLKVRRVEQTFPGVALHLTGIDSREAAADMRGLGVYAADDELPSLGEGRFYYHDLRGLELWRAPIPGPNIQPNTQAATEPEHLGHVVDVLDMGYQDLLQVSHDYGESLIPLQAPYVQIEQIDGLPSRIFLTPEAPAGLLGDLDSNPMTSLTSKDANASAHTES